MPEFAPERMCFSLPLPLDWGRVLLRTSNKADGNFYLYLFSMGHSYESRTKTSNSSIIEYSRLVSCESNISLLSLSFFDRKAELRRPFLDYPAPESKDGR